MTGINRAPIVLDGLYTRYYEGQASVDNPQALGKLVGLRNIVAVIIQNRLNNLDNSPNPIELMIGAGSSCLWQLLPGTESSVIYASNLNDVWVRARVAVESSLTGAVGSLVEGSVTMTNNGADYTAEDVLTLFGDSGTIIVDTVDGSGNILTFHVGTPGQGYAVSATPLTTTGGTGSGAQFTVDAVNINQVRFPFMLYCVE